MLIGLLFGVRQMEISQNSHTFKFLCRPSHNTKRQAKHFGLLQNTKILRAEDKLVKIPWPSFVFMMMCLSRDAIHYHQNSSFASSRRFSGSEHKYYSKEWTQIAVNGLINEHLKEDVTLTCGEKSHHSYKYSVFEDVGKQLEKFNLNFSSYNPFPSKPSTVKETC